MRILLLGSIAYDNIMVFEGRFREHILPDQIHMLNVAFLVPALRREFGGCAANIAYSLSLLGGEPLIMATVGEDADSYYRRLDALAVPDTTEQGFEVHDHQVQLRGICRQCQEKEEGR